MGMYCEIKGQDVKLTGLLSKAVLELAKANVDNPKFSGVDLVEEGGRIFLGGTVSLRYGEVLDSFRANIRKVAGNKSADAIQAAIRFKITDVRPLIAPSA